MNDPILINILLFGIGALVGYVTGLIRANSLEKRLSHAIAKGKEVCILVDKEGVSYRMEDNKLKVTRMNAEEIKGDND